MKMLLAIGAGGAIGAIARHLLTVRIAALAGHAFPWGTLTVNVLGALVLGALVEVFALVWSPSPALHALLTVGMLGSLTTFSAFTAESYLMIATGQIVPAIAYVAGSAVLALVGFWAGLACVRMLSG